MEEKTNKVYNISFLDSLWVIMLIILCLGEPDLLDQLIKIAQNYAETMKCN